MKNLLFAILILAFGKSYCQTFPDIIVNKSNDTIKCEITFINDDNLFYKRQINKSQIMTASIYLNNILYYELNTKNVEILTKDNKPPQINNSIIDSSYLTTQNIQAQNNIPNTNKSIVLSNKTFRDSVYIELKYLNKNLDYLRLNFEYHHKEYITGISLIGVGIGVSIIGTLISLDNLNSKVNTGNNTVSYLPAIAGSGISFIGWIVVIDSDKWFKMASMKPNQYY